MQLKILVFPLAFIISIYGIFFMIRPEISNFNDNRKLITEREEVLQSITEKNENIRKLVSYLEANKDVEDRVIDYIPPKKQEERVVDGINYLASTRDMSLSDLTLKSEVEPIVKEELKGLEGVPTSYLDAPGSDTANNSAQTPPDPYAKYSMINIVASPTIVGEYQDIKDFVIAVYGMELFKGMNSLTISKPKNTQDSESEEGGSSSLIMKMSANFSYLLPVRVGSRKPYESAKIFRKTSFDFQIETLEEMIYKEIPDLKVGNQGRENPFFL